MFHRSLNLIHRDESQIEVHKGRAEADKETEGGDASGGAAELKGGGEDGRVRWALPALSVYSALRQLTKLLHFLIGLVEMCWRNKK